MERTDEELKDVHDDCGESRGSAHCVESESGTGLPGNISITTITWASSPSTQLKHQFANSKSPGMIQNITSTLLHLISIVQRSKGGLNSHHLHAQQTEYVDCCLFRPDTELGRRSVVSSPEFCRLLLQE